MDLVSPHNKLKKRLPSGQRQTGSNVYVTDTLALLSDDNRISHFYLSSICCIRSQPGPALMGAKRGRGKRKKKEILSAGWVNCINSTCPTSKKWDLGMKFNFPKYQDNIRDI